MPVVFLLVTFEEEIDAVTTETAGFSWRSVSMDKKLAEDGGNVMGDIEREVDVETLEEADESKLSNTDCQDDTACTVDGETISGSDIIWFIFFPRKRVREIVTL